LLNINATAVFPKDELWSNFEKALGDFDIDKYVKWHNKLCESPFNDSRQKQNYLDNLLIGFKDDIKWCFREWIQSLDIRKKPMLNFGRNTLFLSFNYTKTLECVYKIPVNNVLHIHHADENIATDEFAQYVIGHNKKPVAQPINISEVERDAREFVDFWYNNKDTQQIIARHQSCFDKLVNVDEIIVLGHSLNEIDFPYFEEIVKHIDKSKVKWKISYFSENDHKRVNEFVKEIGIDEKLVEIQKIEKICGIY
jgi:hypothetical protein